ncbi:cytochrome P450 monooxygenase [Corynespora cassiicola Philippines]|uniref:Cytochrome P450 monooxygenase n=1 Tax=Corynespora cassiicola Philippines TaxID=1448308 RepID=A0A2T2P3Z6_CORCC|nr:cytochrome P450 monooxygenase [Corynespora cassiicola Philippines]
MLAHLFTVEGEILKTPSDYTWVYLAVVGLLSLRWVASHLLTKKSNVPLYNPKKWYELSNSRAKLQILFNLRETLDTWFAEHPEQPIRVLTDMGELTVVSPTMANTIKSDPRLSFSRANNPQFHHEVAGFDPFREAGKNSGRLAKTVIKKDLTKLLNKVTWPLAQEALLAFPHYLGTETEWRKIPLRATILPLIGRLSSRVFVGEEQCRNEEWLGIISGYAANSFMAADQLRIWPKPLRRLVSNFHSHSLRLRKQMSHAHGIIDPIREKRRVLKAEAASRGEKLHFEDAMEWFDRESGGTHDEAALQVFLSLVAIHTTSDLVSQLMTDLSLHPEIIPDLKEEVVRVLGEEGWTKSALFKMRLLDSAIKESQRLKPVIDPTMLRAPVEDYTLPDGTIILKDYIVAVSTHAMRDPAIYKDPETWDGYRFFRQRQQPGKDLSAQLITTSPEHLGFGHGLHSCPGRFFAANEIKLAMVFMLLQYEWRLLPGAKPQTMNWGNARNSDPSIEIEIRHTARINIDPKAGIVFV